MTNVEPLEEGTTRTIKKWVIGKLQPVEVTIGVTENDDKNRIIYRTTSNTIADTKSKSSISVSKNGNCSTSSIDFCKPVISRCSSVIGTSSTSKVTKFGKIDSTPSTTKLIDNVAHKEDFQEQQQQKQHDTNYMDSGDERDDEILVVKAKTKKKKVITDDEKSDDNMKLKKDKKTKKTKKPLDIDGDGNDIVKKEKELQKEKKKEGKKEKKEKKNKDKDKKKSDKKDKKMSKDGNQTKSIVDSCCLYNDTDDENETADAKTKITTKYNSDTTKKISKEHPNSWKKQEQQQEGKNAIVASPTFILQSPSKITNNSTSTTQPVAVKHCGTNTSNNIKPTISTSTTSTPFQSQHQQQLLQPSSSSNSKLLIRKQSIHMKTKPTLFRTTFDLDNNDDDSSDSDEDDDQVKKNAVVSEQPSTRQQSVYSVQFNNNNTATTNDKKKKNGIQTTDYIVLQKKLDNLSFKDRDTITKCQEIQQKLHNLEQEKMEELEKIQIDLQQKKQQYDTIALKRYYKNYTEQNDKNTDVVDNNKIIIQQIRNDNTQLRIRNKDLYAQVTTLQDNNNKLIESNTATDNYLKQVRVHKELCYNDNVKLNNTIIQYKQAIELVQDKYNEINSYYICENFIKNIYKRLITAIVTIVEDTVQADPYKRGDALVQELYDIIEPIAYLEEDK